MKRPFSDRSFSSASIYMCGIFSFHNGSDLVWETGSTHLLLLELDLLHGVMRLVVQKARKVERVARRKWPLARPQILSVCGGSGFNFEGCADVEPDRLAVLRQS